MSVIQVKRGDIHYANLDPVVGRETGKTRPVLVIQNDIVAVITEYSEKKASYPICVAIKKGDGLKKDSVVNLSQIRTIDKNRLSTPKLGTLPNDSMKKVDNTLKNSLALS